MNIDQYDLLMRLLIEIRDRLPVPSAAPADSAVKVITLPEEPPVGTILRDADDDEWRRHVRGWQANDSQPREDWSTVCKFAPLTVVSTLVQPAAKSTDAILADVRARINDWRESSNITVRDCAEVVLAILDGK